MSVKNILVYCVLLLLFFRNSILAQVNPITNVIEVDVSTFHVQNGTSTYDSSFSIGYDLGMKEVGLFLNWTSIETAPNTFDFSILDIANVFYPASNISVDINLNPINTNRLEVPSDLTTVSFDDPQMINRYKVLLDSIKQHIPNITISSFIIGSEIGAYLGNDSVKWLQYTNFYNATMNYARTLWPSLKVAVELQFSDFINYNLFAQQINANSDYIGVSYYPLWPNFTVKPTWVVTFDMDTLVDMFPSKPICFYQYGYPSSPSCNSSDSLQSDFIRQTFNSWDYFSSSIRLIDFTWMTDLDTVAINYYSVYYGLNDTSFLAFLQSIGLRTWYGNGADKQALNELRCQAKQRGFNNLILSCTPTEKDDVSITSKEIQIFPNPNNGKFVIQIESTKSLVLKVYNLIGEELYQQAIGSNLTEIDLSELNAGVYILSLNDGLNQSLKKLVINN